ncbi:MFS transporter [Rathayibacter sp. KR2-224]|uniref:MFS transporter n=1 Tax=Rathayibacter sp. KR2-224 TaxID=3400913 RepID=UPI003BFC85B2
MSDAAAPAPDPGPEPGARRRTGLAVAGLSLGTALNPLNSSMIAVALVDLQKTFMLGIAEATWVITAFYLASAAGQPLMGRLGDRFGPRRLFVFGMAVVIVVSALTPFAPSFALVCVGRIGLAIGTATAFPSAVAMVRPLSAQSGVTTPRLLGRIQIANTAGAAVGPVLGGLLVSTLGWQAIFAVNVPLAALALVGTWMLAPADRARRAERFRVLVLQSDIPGIALFVGTLVALLIFLLGLQAPAWWLLAVAVLAGGCFVWREQTASVPFINLRLLAANRSLMMVYLCFAVFNLVYYTAFFGLPQLLQEHGGYGAGVTGLLMFPLAAVTIGLTPLGARWIETRGLRFTLITGGVGLIAGAGLLAVAAATVNPVAILLITAAMGAPYCVVSIAMSQALYASAAPKDAGVAAGIFQTSRYVGAILATTILGIVFVNGSGADAVPEWITVIAIATGLAVVHAVLLASWHPRSYEEQVHP